MNNPVGQLDLTSAAEFCAGEQHGRRQLHRQHSTDTASAFTATDRLGRRDETSAGTVVGSNGSSPVDGGHTYADEGFPATVTITHTPTHSDRADRNVAVADTDVISVQGTTLTGNRTSLSPT